MQMLFLLQLLLPVNLIACCPHFTLTQLQHGRWWRQQVWTQMLLAQCLSAPSTSTCATVQASQQAWASLLTEEHTEEQQQQQHLADSRLSLKRQQQCRVGISSKPHAHRSTRQQQ